jgi:hypothetical protein
MPEITLLSTRHVELWKCSSDGLCAILERIQPEVIFEELPPSYFNAFHVDMTRSNLESVAINKYLESHIATQVLVDSEEMPPQDFFDNYNRLLQRIEGLANIYGVKYCELADKNKEETAVLGFPYLNSQLCIQIQNALNGVIDEWLSESNDQELSNIRKSWLEVHDKREDHMLQKIYEYSENHNYERAVFLCGAAHRGALIEKIERMQVSAKVKLEWVL